MMRGRALLVLAVVGAGALNLACSIPNRSSVLKAAADELAALETRGTPEGSAVFVGCDDGAEMPAAHVRVKVAALEPPPADPVEHAEYHEWFDRESNREVRVWREHGWDLRSSGASKRIDGFEVRASIDPGEGGYVITTVINTDGLCT